MTGRQPRQVAVGIEWPLAGRRVVVTRAVHQADKMVELLAARGARPVLYPCIAIAPPDDTRDLDQGLKETLEGDFDWLVLTSANVVQVLRERLVILGQGIDDLAGVPVAAVGPATAAAARLQLGLEVDLMPEEYVAEALAEVLQPIAGSRVFLPQADIARPILRDELVKAGADVVAVTAYQTVVGTGGDDVHGLMARGAIDAITFTSPSTVANFVTRYSSEGGELRGLANVCVASIGPVTTTEARNRQMRVDVTPPEHTLAGLITGLETYFSIRGTQRAESDPFVERHG
ncbi:MAG: uroporphyrinogen-III synthase [Planctomycetes bacterium]|nr:uroporphyrinogen-III synthase [Planctomycetota bacterium]